MTAHVEQVAPQPDRIDSSGRTQLHGRILWLARGAYVCLLVLVLGLFLLGLPAEYRFLTSGYIGVSESYNAAGELVLSPLPGLAAAEAGIQTGDVLLRVNNQPVPVFLPRAESQRNLLGPVGTAVQITVRRGNGDARTYTINRDERLFEQMGLSPDKFALYFLLLDVLVALGLLIPALIISIQKSDDWVALFLSATLLILFAGDTGAAVALGVVNPAWRFLLPLLGFTFNVFVLTLLFVFPNGKFVPRWTRWALGIGIIWALLKQLPAPYNPLYQPLYLGNFFDVAMFGLGIYAQIFRYRTDSTVIERQQTKWVVLGMAVAFVGQYGYNLPQFLIPALQEPGIATFQFRVIGQAIASLSLIVLAASILFSILRYRLYEIDVILNRTLVYVPLTAILAGIFAVTSDLSKQFFVQVLGGQTEAASVLATLVIVITFEPIKGGIQKRVDKYFKQAPDPEKHLTALVERVQARVYQADLQALSHDLLEEAMLGFQAMGGAIYLSENATPSIVSRGWNGVTVLNVSIQANPQTPCLGKIELSGRLDGQEYTKRDRTLLQNAARVVAQAIEQDQVNK